MKRSPVGVGKVAESLNLSSQRIQHLVHLGMPKALRGKYDLDKCKDWYIRYLQEVIQRRESLKTDPATEQRLRLLTAQADAEEDERQVRRGQLLDVADVKMTLMDLALTTKTRIMSIAPVLAPQLVGEESRVVIQTKIEKACRDALSYLSKQAMVENGTAN